MQQRRVVLMCNLKPANMRGVKSQAMVLAATSPDGSTVRARACCGAGCCWVPGVPGAALPLFSGPCGIEWRQPGVHTAVFIPSLPLPSQVELVEPPTEAAIGERVVAEGFPGGHQLGSQPATSASAACQASGFCPALPQFLHNTVSPPPFFLLGRRRA